MHVSIETTNRTDATRLAELTSLLAEMRASDTRHSFYQTLMRRSSKRTSGSGLGIGRIHAESEMELSFRVDADDVLMLRAEAEFAWKGMPA